MTIEATKSAVKFCASCDPIKEGAGRNEKGDLEVTTSISNLVLFKNKVHDGTMSYCVLVGKQWLFISTATYQELMKLVMEQKEVA